MSRFVLTAQLQLQAPNNVAQVVRQIQNQLNNVSVNVQVQGSAQAQRQLQQVTAQTNAATSAADRMGRAFAVSVRRFAAFSIATRAVGLFTSTLSNAIKSAIDFEREMVRVSQVTGESLNKLKGFAKTVTNLSTSLGVASSDLVQAGQLLLQAGISAKDTEVALKTLAKAALAPNFDSLSETTEGAIAILAQFGEGVGALEKQLGSINAVAGAFAVEASDLMDVIRRTGGVFKSSGGDLNELIALFTSVRATTRESAESIGTGLRTIFTRIQRPKTIEFLKQFGVELIDMEGKFVGPYEAVKRLSGALAGLGEGDVTFIRIAEELGGFRQIGKVLPLLQQFTVAQNALNVANKAGNSLTNDAATAQQALAVRIIKVKEEFLALIRGITETSTFQIMANTALSLASALIKIGEAIKPLLPMLAAMAAINLARGLGSFVGGFGRGMASNRTFATGGKVHHFARGGFVPGSGNRDTVPAMLSPGEFVIRKSSVKKLGAGNLAAMNENRFKDGGAMTTAEKLAAARAQSITQNPNRAKTKSYNDGQQSAVRFSVADGNIGAFFMNPEGATDGSKSFKQQSFDITNSKILSLPGISPKEVRLKDKKGNVLPRMATDKQKFSAKGILEAGNISTFYPSFTDVSKGSLSSIIESNVKQKLSEAVVDTANFISGNKLLDIPPIDANDALMRQTAAQRIQADTGAIKTTAGYLFEGVVDAITGARPASSNAVFDFPATSLQGNRKRLGALFGNMAGISGLKQADAKASYSSKIIDGGPGSGSISSKIINSINNGVLAGIKVKAQKRHFGGIISKFATGGGVGTDTVPALLTPGEFVVNRSSAQRIGYGNLNRMNKVGRYAKGGVVQRFAAGGTATSPTYAETTGAMSSSGIMGQIAKEREKLEKENINTIRKVYQQSYKDIKAYHEEQVRDAKASGASMDQIRQIFDKSNATIKQLKSDTAGQVQVAKQSAATQAKQNVLETRRSQPDIVFAEAKKRAAAGETLTANTDFGKQAYAKLTTEQLKQVNAIQKATMATNTAARADADEATASRQAASADSLEAQASKKMDFGNVAMGLSLVSGTIQAMLPPLDENSGLLLKMSHGLLGLITTITGIGFALSAFGVTLTGATIAQAASTVSNFLLGKSGAAASAACTSLAVSAGWAAKSLGMSSGMSMGIAKFIQGAAGVAGKVATVAGPFIAAAAASYLVIKGFNALVSAAFDVSAKLKKSIESGDVGAASSLSGQQYDLEAANTTRGAFGTGGAVIGGIIGSIFGPVGTSIGLIVGSAAGAAIGSIVGTVAARVSPEFAEKLNIILGGNTRDSAIALAESQAGAARTQKELEKAQQTATIAMQNFENGTISASDALAKIRSATSGAGTQEKRATDFAMKNLENRASGVTGYLRESLSYLTFGAIEGRDQRNTRLGQQGAEQIRQASKLEAQAFQLETGARTANIRSQLFSGNLSKEEIKKQAMGDRLERMRALSSKATALAEAGDQEGADAAQEAFVQLKEEVAQINREMANLDKEIEIAKAKFNALNLGLRSVTAAADASALRMAKAMNSFDLAVVPGTNAMATLEAALTAAGQNISKGEFDASLSEVSGIMRKFGASAEQVGNFEELAKGVATVQRDFPNIFETLKERLKSGELRGMSAEDLGKEFKNIVSQSLDNANIGEAAKARIKAAMGDVKIEGDDLAKIMAGDISVLEKYFGDAAEEVAKNMKAFGEKWISANQELIKATQERIEAERNLVAAQREAIDLYMEGRDIQAKYGGAVVTTAEKRATILAKANAGAARNGLGAMRTGSVAELRARNRQILTGFAGIEGQRGNGSKSEMGAEGAQMQGTQQNLQQAQKDQIQTIRDLIKLEEEELKIIQEKNRMEKDSLEALISGDIDKFFEQQAAAGAQAAIATGDMSLANMFGQKAIGMAFQDIMRQMEAGVQTMFGRQLGGPGGLAEQAARASLASRGITDPRMAQMLAGTTAEEESIKATLRELGGVLGETGIAGAAIAEMQVQTAQMKIDQANLVISNLETGGAPAEGMYRGGTVYANRGIFVPRGTDTVPAMLTPGEFVVRREAVNRGNNLQLLRAINNGGNAGGFARGGKVGYYNTGGMVQYKALGDLIARAGQAIGIDPKVITNLGTVFTSFTNSFNDSIKNLQNTKLQVKLDSVNVNVNLTGTSMLSQVTEETRNQIMSQVVQKIQNEYSVGPNGKLTQNNSKLPKINN